MSRREARDPSCHGLERQEHRFHCDKNVKAKILDHEDIPTDQQHLMSQASNSRMTETCRTYNAQSVAHARRHADPCPDAGGQASSRSAQEHCRTATCERGVLGAVAVKRRQLQSSTFNKASRWAVASGDRTRRRTHKHGRPTQSLHQTCRRDNRLRGTQPHAAGTAAGERPRTNSQESRRLQ